MTNSITEVDNYPLSKRVARWLETQTNTEIARLAYREAEQKFERAKQERETAEKLLIEEVPPKDTRRFLIEVEGVMKLLEIRRASGFGCSDIVALYDVEKLED